MKGKPRQQIVEVLDAGGAGGDTPSMALSSKDDSYGYSGLRIQEQ